MDACRILLTLSMALAVGQVSAQFFLEHVVSSGPNVELVRQISRADLDLDGYPEVIWAGASGLMSNELGPDGIYSPAVNLAPASNLYGFELGDDDLDGDVDVLAWTAALDLVRWENEGGGVLSALEIVLASSGSSIWFTAPVDFDGDAVPDVVVQRQPEGLMLLQGIAGGGYQAPENLFPWVGPTLQRAVDFDNDADQDLLLWKTGAQSHLICAVNDGNGGFVQDTIFTSTTEFSRFLIADVNGDLQEDLVGYYGNVSVIVALRTGVFSFGQMDTLDFACGPLRHIAIADMDLDGDNDLVASCDDDENSFWSPNDGSGAFGLPTVIDSLHFASALLVADLTLDGYPDLVLDNSNLMLFASDSSLVFVGPELLMDQPRTVGDLVLADVDGDGEEDIITASGEDNLFAWYKLSSGTSEGQKRYIGRYGITNRLEAGDVNGDGVVDLASVSQFGGLVSVVSDGQGAYHPSEIHVSEPGPVNDAAFVDLNGDGALDLAMAIGTDPMVAWKENDGTGLLLPTQELFSLPADGACLLPLDVDQDGTLDFVVSGANGALDRAMGLGNVQYGALQSLGPGQQGVEEIIAFSADGDAYQDIAIVSVNDNRVRFYKGAGQLGFDPMVELDADLDSPSDLAHGDMDGDGDQDLVVCSAADDLVRVYLGDGNGSFMQGVNVLAGISASRLGLSDIDNDGLPDIVLYDRSAKALSWFENQWDHVGQLETDPPHRLHFGPNPFSVTTSCKLPRGAQVAAITVHDVIGRTIAAEVVVSGDRLVVSLRDRADGLVCIGVSFADGTFQAATLTSFER